jgi:hypothetical protein
VTPGFSPLRRLLALSTAVALLAEIAPPAAAGDTAQPPARVGQIAALAGAVSFNGNGSGGWAAAVLNYPVSAGDALYTQDGAQATMALDSSQLTLAADTELDVTALDDSALAANESQGEVFLAIDNLQPGQSFTIATPRGSIGITQNGRYDITAGDAAAPSVLTVFQGAAVISAPGATMAVGPGQAGVMSGTDQTVLALAQPAPDRFATALLSQSAPPPPAYAPPAVAQMTGTYQLARYGSWNQDPQYGAVWYPRVDAGWAPYREGHWVNVAPWGWTWVDAAPWGFAPSHYGRWVQVQDRWGWAPCPAYQGGDAGPDYRPVYAPAVVSFFGLAVVAGITAAALSSGSIGWVPLGPQEPYYPPYRASPDYIRRINIVNVRNINIVNTTNNYYGGNFAPDHFANRRAATFVPAAAMTRGDPVARYGRPVAPAQLAAARPVDPGFGGHAPGGPAAGGPAAGGPAFRLPPPSRALAQTHPGLAPRPTAFSQRQEMPPAVVSHGQAPGVLAPAQHPPAHPPAGMPGRAQALPAMQQPGLPDTHPQSPYRPGAARPAALPPVFHPAEPARPAAPPVFYPTEPARPAAPPAFHPAEPARPAAPPVFHPAAPPQVFHPAAPPQVFHPAAPPQVFHPAAPPPVFHPAAPPPLAAQPFHPAAQARPPEPRPPEPRPAEQRPAAPGGGREANRPAG